MVQRLETDPYSHAHILDLIASRRAALRGLSAGGVAALAALLSGAAARAQTPPAAPTGAAAFLTDWSAAWSARDAAKVASFFTADTVFEDLAFELVVHGQPAMQAAAADYMRAVPDLRLPLVGGFAAGDWVAAEWGFSGTDEGGIIAGVPPTGKRFDVRGASLFLLRDGKIAHETDFYNLATILRQLGLLTLPDGPATPAATPTS